jgi:broad specificity phosphatase PhoE
MVSTLASVNWGGPTRQLLAATRNLVGQPAIMHIRHSERTIASREEIQLGLMKYDGRKLLSTPTGLRAAMEFGLSLPVDREYTLYHTRSTRAYETAEAIHRGIVEAGGSAEIGGIIPYSPVLDGDTFNWWVQSRKWFPQDGAYSYTCQWIAGLIPKTTIEPSGEFAQELARISMENLKAASSTAFHIYVSHDMYIATLIFHWFGIPPYTNGIRYLEGFLLQISEEGLNVWLRDRNEMFEFPPWWPKPP